MSRRVLSDEERQRAEYFALFLMEHGVTGKGVRRGQECIEQAVDWRKRLARLGAPPFCRGCVSAVGVESAGGTTGLQARVIGTRRAEARAEARARAEADRAAVVAGGAVAPVAAGAAGGGMVTDRNAGTGVEAGGLAKCVPRKSTKRGSGKSTKSWPAKGARGKELGQAGDFGEAEFALAIGLGDNKLESGR